MRNRIQQFATTPSLPKNAAPLPPRTPLPSNSITISYLKGSGPGGQKINKTNSAVQIKHLPSGLVIKCQDTRSRDQNEKLAMRRLQDKLEMAEKEGTGELSRVERRRGMLRKRKASKAKKAKRKYRALGEGKAGLEEDDEVDGEDAVGEETDGEGTSGSMIEEEVVAPKEGIAIPAHEIQQPSNPG
jgi:protein subunit release factor B